MSLPQTDRQLSVQDIASIEGPIRVRGEGFGEMNFSNGVDLLRWQTEHPNTKIWTIQSNDPSYIGELSELEVVGKGTPTQDILTQGLDQDVQIEEKPISQEVPHHRTYADIFYNMSDWDSLLGQTRVNLNKRAWQRNPQYMQNWTDSGNAAAAFTVAPFATAALGEYALPWLSENIFPYLSAKGWLAATQAAGNTPAWLTPTSAAAIDATLAGTATGASINDMLENGPTVENVLGTTLGGIGLAYEAAPTIMDGYTAARNALRPAIIGMKMRGIPLSKIQSTGLPLNVGWGPRQTISVTHTSDQASPLLLYNEQRWDALNEGANPLGIWFQGKLGIPRSVNTGATPTKAWKALRARQLFSRRPYTHSGDLTLDKPFVTIGDVPNRSALSYQAEQMGADGLIYNNVYDNGYDANQVLLSFKHPDNYIISMQRLMYNKGGKLNKLKYGKTQ